MTARTRRGHGSDRLLVVLAGGLVGILFSCCVGAALLLLLEAESPVTAPSSPPPTYDIEAIVEEDYINRTMLDSAADIPSPLPLVAGHLDVVPGEQAHFTSQMKVGPLQPVFRGTIRLQPSDDGGLELELQEVRIGYLPVTPLVPTSQVAAINAAINRMLAARAGPVGLQVAGVTTDETSLHIYLVAMP